jgi:hypothetical protein
MKNKGQATNDRLALARRFREFRDFDDIPTVSLAEFELAFANLQGFDPGLERGWRNAELGSRP